MQADQLREHIGRSLAEVVNYADELRDLDQALGDGDLGITVTLGAEAVIEALSVLPESATPAEIARECAKAFANANPSTMAALVAGGLARRLQDLDGADGDHRFRRRQVREGCR